MEKKTSSDIGNLFANDPVLIDACEKFGVKLSNAHTYYTRCNGDKYIMEKYFKNHATIKRLPTDCV